MTPKVIVASQAEELKVGDTSYQNGREQEELN